jgi:hypothetical protein
MPRFKTAADVRSRSATCNSSAADPNQRRPRLARGLVVLFLGAGCASFPVGPPQTAVILDNDYAPSTKFVIHDAWWQDASFSGQAIEPGASSSAENTVPASANNTAYVLIAPGWDPDGGTAPTSFLLLQSRAGFAISLSEILHLPVDDEHFEGNCTAGSPLTQEQANFLTHVVFPGDFEGFAYDAATCTTIQRGDAGAD